MNYMQQIDLDAQHQSTRSSTPHAGSSRVKRDWMAVAACGLLVAAGGLYWALEHRAVPIQAATPPPPTVTVGAPLSRTSLQSPLLGCFGRRRPLGDCFLACLRSMVQGPRTGLLYLLAMIK